RRHTRCYRDWSSDVCSSDLYLEADGFEKRIEGRVDAPEFKATSVSLHELDRTARVLKRTRTWRIEGRADVEDYAEYRLLFPEEEIGRASCRERGWMSVGEEV